MITAEDFLLNKVREINYKQPTPKQVELWMIEFTKIHVTEASIKCAESVFSATEEEIENFNKVLNAYHLDNIV